MISQTNKKRISGPFTVEAVPSPIVNSIDVLTEELPELKNIQQNDLLRQNSWRDELLKTGIRGKGGLESPLISGRLKSGLETGLITRTSIFESPAEISRQFQTPRAILSTKQTGRQVTKQLELAPQIFQPSITPRMRTPFEPFGDFGFVPFALFPSLGGVGERKKPKKRARARVRIAPSFTAIVLGIEEAAFISPTFGVLPGQIRGLETGKSKKTKKKSKKKKKR